MQNVTLLSQKRTNPSTQDYIFISYAHADREFVYSNLLLLDKKHLNFWFDDELQAGNRWDEVVRDILTSPHCRGVIFFASSNSITSSACEKEIVTAFELQKNNPDFQMVLISIKGNSILGMIRDYFVESATLNDKQLEQTFPQKRLATVASLLSENIIYLIPDSDNSHIGKICSAFSTKNLPVFSDDETKLKSLYEKIGIACVDGQYYMQLGTFPQEINKAFSLATSQGISVVSGKKNYSLNGRYYIFSPLGWKMLRLNGDLLTLCCERAIIGCTQESIASVLAQIKSKLDVTYEIVELRIPYENELDEIKKLFPAGITPTDFSNSVQKTLATIFFASTQDKTILINRTLNKMQAPTKNTTFGYCIPIMTIKI